MARKWFEAQVAQYKRPTVQGNGLVQWDGGVKCYLPAATLYGAGDAQDPLTFNNGTYRMNGKNLIPQPYRGSGVPGYQNTFNGITYTVNEDYSITANGTATSQSQYPLVADNAIALPQRGYWLSGCPKGGGISTYYIQSYNGYRDTGNGVGLFASADTRHLVIFIAAGVTVKDLTFYPQLEVGGAATKYEPYFDGGRVNAPVLRAIPGTDYVDEWDAVTGQGIRRCGVIYNYAGEEITTPYISTTGGQDAGADIVFGIPDTPFYSPPAARLIQPDGCGTLIQTADAVANCPLSATYLTHA